VFGIKFRLKFLASRCIVQKPVRISGHAWKRIARYGLDEELVVQALRHPDRLVEGHHGRRIAHKSMNGFVVRVVYEEDGSLTVVTVYPARRERYEGKV